MDKTKMMKRLRSVRWKRPLKRKSEKHLITKQRSPNWTLLLLFLKEER